MPFRIMIRSFIVVCLLASSALGQSPQPPGAIVAIAGTTAILAKATYLEARVPVSETLSMSFKVHRQIQEAVNSPMFRGDAALKSSLQRQLDAIYLRVAFNTDTFVRTNRANYLEPGQVDYDNGCLFEIRGEIQTAIRLFGSAEKLWTLGSGEIEALQVNADADLDELLHLDCHPIF